MSNKNSAPSGGFQSHDKKCTNFVVQTRITAQLSESGRVVNSKASEGLRITRARAFATLKTMQQNLNPKGKKSQQDYARNQRNGLAPAESGRLLLPALFLACRGLRTLAHCTSPVKKIVHRRSWTSVDGFNSLGLSTNGLHQLSGKKPQKHRTGSCLMAGNGWICFHSLTVIVLFVMHRLLRVY